MALTSSVARTRGGVRALLPLATAFPGLDQIANELRLKILLPQPDSGEVQPIMRRIALVIAVALCSCSFLSAQSSSNDSDHIEVGVFADYLNLSRTSPHINFVGVGARAGFNVHRNVQLEAEMSYDFERNFTSTFSDGINTQLVQTNLRPLTALFGPKFQTNAGPFRAFATFKAGLINFTTTNANAQAGFNGALGSVTSGNTRAAIYPGLGVEGFWGPFGLRLDAGDAIYFDNGTRNNLKVTFGPAFRF